MEVGPWFDPVLYSWIPGTVLWPVLAKGYRDAELRKMEARDLTE